MFCFCAGPVTSWPPARQYHKPVPLFTNINLFFLTYFLIGRISKSIHRSPREALHQSARPVENRGLGTLSNLSLHLPLALTYMTEKCLDILDNIGTAKLGDEKVKKPPLTIHNNVLRKLSIFLSAWCAFGQQYLDYVDS